MALWRHSRRRPRRRSGTQELRKTTTAKTSEPPSRQERQGRKTATTAGTADDADGRGWGNEIATGAKRATRDAAQRGDLELRNSGRRNNGDGVDRGWRGWARMLLYGIFCSRYPRNPCNPRSSVVVFFILTTDGADGRGCYCTASCFLCIRVIRAIRGEVLSFCFFLTTDGADGRGCYCTGSCLLCIRVMRVIRGETLFLDCLFLFTNKIKVLMILRRS